MLRSSEALGVVWLGTAFLVLAATVQCFQQKTNTPKTGVAIASFFLLAVVANLLIVA
jgi:hypothetical protein